MILILVRHGKTIENEQNILQGHMPGRLSADGIRDAEALSITLKDEPIAAIYTSDLARAADTARILARFHHGAEFHLVNELREGDLGSYTGRHHSEIDFNDRPEGVEAEESIRDRTWALVCSIYGKYQDKTIIFVGHAGSTMALMTAILGLPVSKMREMELPKNTSIRRFQIQQRPDSTLFGTELIEQK